MMATAKSHLKRNSLTPYLIGWKFSRRCKVSTFFWMTARSALEQQHLWFKKMEELRALVESKDKKVRSRYRTCLPSPAVEQELVNELHQSMSNALRDELQKNEGTTTLVTAMRKEQSEARNRMLALDNKLLDAKDNAKAIEAKLAQVKLAQEEKEAGGVGGGEAAAGAGCR
jgi:hypothetical protein